MGGLISAFGLNAFEAADGAVCAADAALDFGVLTGAGRGGSALWAHHKDDLSRERPL